MVCVLDKGGIGDQSDKVSICGRNREDDGFWRLYKYVCKSGIVMLIGDFAYRGGMEARGKGVFLTAGCASCVTGYREVFCMIGDVRRTGRLYVCIRWLFGYA